MTERICYVYGVVAPNLDLAGAPTGVDDAAVLLESEGPLAALVSLVDAAVYSADTLDARTANLEWLAPRATAHDRVLTWASDAAPVAPMPLLSLFRSAHGVRAMLRDRRTELMRAMARAKAGREYHLRVFRLDRELAVKLPSLSPKIAELEEAAAAASPGQRYLLGRKLEDERRTEIRRVGAEVAREVHATLREDALAAVTDPLPRPGGDAGGGDGAAVLNAAYLVSQSALTDFRAALTALIERREPEGFRFEFTGPWPVYHFVREAGDGE
ncbi:MAG TPA: GvpL/GvpF family gas vesicle protein [Gemmatimonadaceae bacterium]|nr:GvpL/GvpF family gas vesicle protein [Gemmatimonadaceae bacterium]